MLKIIVGLTFMFHVGAAPAHAPHVWMTLHCQGSVGYTMPSGWRSGPDGYCITSEVEQ